MWLTFSTVWSPLNIRQFTPSIALHAGRVDPKWLRICLTPALSWLYPAHTGQVTSFPEAQRNLEASEANGTVSQYSVCLTRPWLTGACLSSRGPPSLSKLNPNCLLPNTCSPIKTTQTCVCTQLATDGLIPIGKLGEGNSASILKGNRMVDCSREINWFILPVFEPMWNVEFPLFLFFPYRHVNACKTATHIMFPPTSRMPVYKTRKYTNIRTRFSLWSRQNIKSAPHVFFAATNNFNCLLKAQCDGVWVSWDRISSIFCT